MPSKQTTRAARIAAVLYAGQEDKGSKPYFTHLEAVVEILLRRWPDAPAYVVEAAWLHDAIEDTEATAESLRRDGVSEDGIRIIQAVSRDPGLTYRNWIKALADSGNVWAIRLKLCDNEHNSDPARRLPNSDIIERRYMPARRVLEEALAKWLIF